MEGNKQQASSLRVSAVWLIGLATLSKMPLTTLTFIPQLTLLKIGSTLMISSQSSLLVFSFSPVFRAPHTYFFSSVFFI
jgi:hypothetical protein